MRKLYLLYLLAALPIGAGAQFADNFTPASHFKPQATSGLPVVHVLDVQIEGDRAFTSGYGGISIFDISDLNSPVQLSNYNPVSGPTGDFYHRMAVKDGIVYGARRNGGVDILDFRDEQQPRLLSTYRLNDQTAYETVTLYSDTLFASVYKNGVEIIDVSDPENPQHLGTVPALNAFASVKWGHYLFIADVLEGLVVWDIRDISHPRLLSTTPTLGAAQFIDRSGPFVYLAVGAAGVDIFDVSNPQEPKFVSNYPGLGFCPHLAVQDDRLFLAEWEVVELVDVSDPYNPKRLAKEIAKPQSMGVQIAGDLFFVADWAQVQVYRHQPGDGPDIFPDHRFLSFGDIIPGAAEEQHVVISNVGQEILDVTSVQANDPALEVDSEPFHLAPGEKKSISVSFKPSSDAKMEAEITIASNDPDQSPFVIPVYAGYRDFGPGDLAPDFTLEDVYGTSHSLSDYRGKVVLLTAFASW